MGMSYDEIENMAYTYKDDRLKISLKRRFFLSSDAYIRSLSALVMFSIVGLSVYFGSSGIISLFTFVSFLSCFEWFGLWATTHNYSEPWSLNVLILGYVYIAACLYSLGNLGLKFPMHFFHVAMTTWVTDIFSYIIGSQLKFLELFISPFLGQGKTWPGFVGGLLAGTLIPTILFVAVPLKHALSQNIQTLLIKTFALSLFSQFGDIFESYVKRKALKKDSSTFLFNIPGHGGMLDRIDSLLLASCLGYIYKDF